MRLENMAASSRPDILRLTVPRERVGLAERAQSGHDGAEIEITVPREIS